MTNEKKSLRVLRAEKGLTQEEVAERLGISRTTYCGWEKDIRNASVGKAEALADFYGVTIDNLIFCPKT